MPTRPHSACLATVVLQRGRHLNFPCLAAVICSKDVAHLCSGGSSSSTPPTRVLVPVELCVPFQAWMIKKEREEREVSHSFSFSRTLPLYLVCVVTVCEVCVSTCVCVCVWWVYSSWLLWLVGTGLWFGSLWRARVRVAEHHSCRTATDILAPLGQYKFLFSKI